jgi:hypothetical protein
MTKDHTEANAVRKGGKNCNVNGANILEVTLQIKQEK